MHVVPGLLLAILSKPALAGTAGASSVMTDAGGKHTAELAFDGLLGTGWAEGDLGIGADSWLEVDLGTSQPIDSVSIWPGNLEKGERTFKEYGRPKVLQVWVDGAKAGEPTRIQSEMKRIDLAVDRTGKKVRVEFVEAFEGGVYTDMFVAEMAVNFTEGERARAVEKVDAWRGSKEGQAAQKRYEEQALAAYDKHKADVYDEASLQFLIEAAGEGPEYLRKKVTSLVPLGFRAAALVPDEMAMSAILKLKDPTGIAGLEYAAMRAIGSQQREIQDQVEYFYAWRDLAGGGRRNIRAWGEPGWEVGALQGFGEPLPLEIDRLGSALVVDTANNRIQRFTSGGISDKQWGAPKDVTQYWYGVSRRWYAGGAMANADAGSFMNPVDLVLLPEKEADAFAVLDAAGRLQIFDEEGNGRIGWTVPSDDQAEPKVGGEAYLAYLPKKDQIIAIIGNDAFVFDLKSEKVGQWVVKDGTPNAVEVGSDGKIYMAFGKAIVSYNSDGFRYGMVIDEAILGEGFEDLDITLDEKGEMWVLVDTGWVFKFKKPGKLDWKLRAVDHELIHPRFGVFQGNLLITDRETILPVDAMQAHLDEEQAKADEAALKKAEGKQ